MAVRRSGSSSWLYGVKALTKNISQLLRSRAQNAAVQLQATFQKARDSAPLPLNLRAVNCDGYPNSRA